MVFNQTENSYRRHFFFFGWQGRMGQLQYQGLLHPQYLTAAFVSHRRDLMGHSGNVE